MLKRRTRVTAKVFGFLLTLSVIGAFGVAASTMGERILLVVCAVVPCVMWWALLAARAWAWWTLLVFYALGLYGMGLYAGDVLLPSAPDKLVNLGALGALTLVTVGWPVTILLTDRPKGWASTAQQQSTDAGEDALDSESVGE